ncbi:hypothetical protein ACNOYE_05365 [Nannocystaceae bacterium ST9]
MLRPRLALASFVLASFVPACERERAPTTNPDASSDTSSDTATVEAEPTSGPVSAEFAFLNFGGEGQGAYIESVDKGGLAIVVASFGNLESLPRPLSDVVNGKVDMRRFEENSEPALLDIDAQTLAAAGVVPPARTIWLVGPSGPCAARLGEPKLAIYAPAWPVLEVSWTLALEQAPGCVMEDPREWAPLALLADSLPPELRYVAAQPGKAENDVDLATWDNPHAARARAFVESLGGADELWFRETIVPGTTLAQIDFAAVTRHHPGPGEEYYECGDQERTRTLVGLWQGDRLEEVGLSRDDDRYELIGAFVIGERVLWSLHSHFWQAVVSAPGREAPLVELTTAEIHPEDGGSFGWSVIAYCGP